MEQMLCTVQRQMHRRNKSNVHCQEVYITTNTHRSLDISHGILFPGIRIEKGSNSQLFVESEQCKMLHVHSIHPNSRPDLFQPIEVTDEEESIPDIFVWINHNEPHKKFKLVSKFAIK